MKGDLPHPTKTIKILYTKNFVGFINKKVKQKMNWKIISIMKNLILRTAKTNRKELEVPEDQKGSPRETVATTSQLCC